MRVKVFMFLCTGSNHRSLVTSTMHRKGSAARAEVIDPAIKLKTLCTLFKMTPAANLHYSCIAPSFPVYKNVSFCTRGQRSQPSLDDATEYLRRVHFWISRIKFVFIYVSICHVAKPSPAFAMAPLML